MIAILALGACLVNTALYEARLAAVADADGDGVRAELDCDDADAAVFPGAQETCNERDDDCNGTVDDDAVDHATWYIDADGDGAGTTAAITESCGAPDGYVATADDCDDSRPDVHPGATEVPYNGLDEDCLGGDLADVDGDGETATEAGGDDCDDDDAAVYPGAPETCLDGIDTDCDGADLADCDGDGALAESEGGTDCDDDDATVYGGAPEGWHDLGVDNDCDGRVDDPVTLGLGEADIRLDPPADSGYAGGALGTVADFDGDGTRDIWVGAAWDSAGGAYAGAVFLLGSASLVGASGDVAMLAVGSRVHGTEDDVYLGNSATGAEIDGRGGMLVGAPGHDGGAGRVWWVDGGDLAVGDDVAMSSVGSPFVTGDADAYLGIAPLADQDVDGDGIGDVFVDALATATVYGYSAPALASHTVADADWTVSTGRVGHWLAPSKVGDVDGDGYTDLGVADMSAANDEVGSIIMPGGSAFAGGEFEGAEGWGFLGGNSFVPVADSGGDRLLAIIQYGASIFVNPIPAISIHLEYDADYLLYRTEDDSPIVAGAAYSWFGDAGPAFIFGGPDSAAGSERGDCVAWQSDEFSEGVFSTDLQLHAAGENPGDRAGQALALADDYNGDGDLDLLVGAPQNDASGPGAGRVYLQFAP